MIAIDAFFLILLSSSSPSYLSLSWFLLGSLVIKDRLMQIPINFP